ncbi:MAG TPA: glycogen debranching enzyme GlgX, partial [Burkholderiaceae bacterium]|nr:glycogen debranching enzyme GlgX [Burkholderiaceae bacterium]
MAPTLLHPGRSHPLGSHPLASGSNFSVFSRDARRVELLLYDDVDAAQPAQVIELAPTTNRTWHYWHAFVRGVAPGQLYAFRAHGDFDPARG